MAERLGCRTATVPVSLDDPPVLAVDGVPLDLALLILDGGWVGHSTTWSSSAWGIPARLTAAYLAADIPVVVVSAGAGAGAIASCVAQGASAVFGLDQLPDALRGRYLHRPRSAASGGRATAAPSSRPWSGSPPASDGCCST